MKFLLTPVQARKLRDAIKSKRKCTLTLSSSKQSPHGIELLLSARQIGQLADGRPHKITFHDKNGGLFPLLAAIPAIAGLLGAGAAATTIGKNVYDMAKGRGVGGFLPGIFSPGFIMKVIPSLAAAVGSEMKHSGNGIVETARSIFLDPQFLNLIAKHLEKSGHGLMLGPPRHHY